MKFQSNTMISVDENSFKNVVWKMAAILPCPKCVYKTFIPNHSTTVVAMLRILMYHLHLEPGLFLTGTSSCSARPCDCPENRTPTRKDVWNIHSLIKTQTYFGK